LRVNKITHQCHLKTDYEEAGTGAALDAAQIRLDSDEPYLAFGTRQPANIDKDENPGSGAGIKLTVNPNHSSEARPLRRALQFLVIFRLTIMQF